LLNQPDGDATPATGIPPLRPASQLIVVVTD